MAELVFFSSALYSLKYLACALAGVASLKLSTDLVTLLKSTAFPATFTKSEFTNSTLPKSPNVLTA